MRKSIVGISPEKRKSNVKLGLTLASIALVFLLGFVSKYVFFGA